MKVKLISLLGLMVILVSCSTPSAPEYNPLPSYYQEVSRGWNYFEQDNYALAATSFRKAMVNDVDNSQSEAMIGLAWSLAGINQHPHQSPTQIIHVHSNPGHPIPCWNGIGNTGRGIEGVRTVLGQGKSSR